ncbi:MAG: hypothetical protein K2X93_13250 [Candidatus Obscuribacterales bacterium]|nr:hypothetical protein [Candidatus Obscuribacterales bacterium]
MSIFLSRLLTSSFVKPRSTIESDPGSPGTLSQLLSNCVREARKGDAGGLVHLLCGELDCGPAEVARGAQTWCAVVRHDIAAAALDEPVRKASTFRGWVG